MIKYLIILIALSQIAAAQLLPGGERERYEGGDRKLSSGMAYADFAMKGANMLDEWGVEAGLGFGVHITRKFTLGIGVYQLFSQNIRIHIDETAASPLLWLTYGGAELGYRTPVMGGFEIGAEALIAMGYSNISLSPDVGAFVDANNDWYFLAEPSLLAGWRFTDLSFLQISLGWRIAAGVDYKNVLDDSDLSGAVAGIKLITSF
ncbi:MAG: hypothetical protein ACLFQX_07290 [Candidatus Kapaibacterium sp.]